jgi:predicted DNA-binding antitoxin AbrB/MazE fold protein
MTREVEAVYENGSLRPLEPLPLAEHQHVMVVITEAPKRPLGSYRDMAYLDAVKKEVAKMERIPTLEEIQEITSRDASSWSESIISEREERF